MTGIVIDDEFKALGVPVTLGCIQCAVTVSSGGAALSKAMQAETARAEAALSEAEIATLPVIAATRRAYKACGKDPARYRPSAEALMRRIKQGKGLYRVNNAVDVNNMVSLRTGVSIGLYDMARLSPPLSLRPAVKGESYAGIGKADVNLDGLPVLFDGKGPFGCPTSDSRRTMITETCQTLLMVQFGFGCDEYLKEAMKLAEAWLIEHCTAQDTETWTVEN